MVVVGDEKWCMMAGVLGPKGLSRNGCCMFVGAGVEIGVRWVVGDSCLGLREGGGRGRCRGG